MNRCSLFCFFFSGEVTETEFIEDSVGELIEFFLVNFTWSLMVNSLSSFLDPFPFFIGDGVVLGFSKFLKSNLDFIVGEGTTLVSVKSLIFFSSQILANAISFFSGEVTETEVSEDSIGESVEFFFVNFTWGLGVNSFSSSRSIPNLVWLVCSLGI